MPVLKPNEKLIRLARKWKPKPSDKYGKDKKRLLDFLLQNEITSANPRHVQWLADNVEFEGSYTREQLQNQIIVPLRNQKTVFIGTGPGGLFLVTSPEDAHCTLGFYAKRVLAEQRHARNLRGIAKRARLFEGYSAPSDPTKKSRSLIFIDESGTPALNDPNSPVFVVAAVLIESMEEVSRLECRFLNACAIINRDPSHPLNTAGLSPRKHVQVLRELSLIEYHWAAACFVKPELTGGGFAYPKTFYRYAFQFLVGELLSIGWQSELVIDEYSNDDFTAGLAEHLRRQNAGLPINRLDTINFAVSSKNRLVQLADLVAGAVRLSTEGEDSSLTEINDKMINLAFWPPRA